MDHQVETITHGIRLPLVFNCEAIGSVLVLCGIDKVLVILLILL